MIPMEIISICPDIGEWPDLWSGEGKDIEPGERVRDVMVRFLSSLISKGHSRKTIEEHIDNLWLLGGEIIRELHQVESLRGLDGISLVREFVDEDGGPSCRHLDTEPEMVSYDDTCRRLYQSMEDLSE